MPTISNELPSYPSRRSLREAQNLKTTPAVASPVHTSQVGASPAEVLTPMREYVPTSIAASNLVGEASAAAGSGATSSERPRVKRKPKQVIAAAFAGACVATLALTTALPFFASAASGPEGLVAAASLPEQHLFSGTSINDAGALDAIGAVNVAIDPKSGMPVIAESGLVDPELITNTKLRLPFDQEWPLTDGFAYRTAPVEQFHDAQDFAAPAGTPILAIGSGIVIEAGYANDGCGFGIKLQHQVDGNVLTSRYCHMQVDSHDYAVGDEVSAGVQIGRVGNTGLSFGPHLHLALRLDGVQIDPLPYIQSKIDAADKK